ncbi:Multidrug transporter EmrE [Carnobacterium alterfunditum]|uniref:Multidrug transporter EmrE n=1 Tax=Carnobacterium alterfunditum TaxID=28230 RepID=A0A1N6FAV1_9LACT|nr:SMR family transporter [Carnobacterium alterfunditum]SIN92408.1 Multidrug transporter EmrE [Carnobacterium alterfunditum]
MFYLSLAIICSASIALIFKYTENAEANRYVITSANYFIAFAISLFMIFSRGLLSGVTREVSFAKDFSLLFSNNDHILSPYSSILWGLIVGGIFGSFFFLSFIYYQKSIKENGVGISGTIAKLGILIPMIFSIVIWKEFPSSIQWVGIVLSLVSIVIVNLSQKSIEKFDFKPAIILLFIFGGMAEFSNKFYQKYALNEYKDVFLFALFFVAFLISIFYTFKEKSAITKKDILTGFVVGIPNLFSSYFLILALATLKTSVVFPIYSAGSIVLINIGGFLLFKEKIARKNKVAIILTIIALVLINL